MELLREPAAFFLVALLVRTALRSEQIFLDWGLALRLERERPSWQAVSRAGTRLARRAVVRDPWGFAALSPLLATLVALALEPWLPPASPVSRAG